MTTPIRILGARMDLGQSRRGVDMGPSALRYAGLFKRLEKLGCTVEDAGNIQVPVRDTLPHAGGMSYLPAVVKTCEALYETGRQAVADGFRPLFLGGDHSIAAGTIGGVTHDAPAGVLWIDAHADFNIPETSPSGNIHGMPLAALMGRGAPELINVGRPGPKLSAPDVVLIAIRDLDIGERKLLQEANIGIYTMREIDERGIAAVANEALRQLRHHTQLHISFDADSLDPREAPGVGTPVPGGLTYREAHLLMEIIADTGKVASMDVVEVNPILDQRNRTAEIAVELVASLFGESIL